MSRLLARLQRQAMQTEHDRRVARALLEAEPRRGGTASGNPGDPALWRGIPMVGAPGGLGGAILGTRPGVR